MTLVLLPRPAGSDADAALLEKSGVDVVADPYVEITPLLDAETMAARRALAAELPRSALVVTSARALGALIDFCDVDRESVVYAIGPTSERAARDAGFLNVRTPEDDSGNVALERLLAHDRPASVVVPRSSAAPSTFADDLTRLGIEVHQAVLYTTTTVSTRPSSADALADDRFDAVIVRSGSAGRALASYVPVWPTGTRVIAAGRPTALVLRELEIPVSAIAAQPDPATVVATTLNVLGRNP